MYNTISLPHVNWLVHDVPARLVLKKSLTLSLGMVGVFSRLMTDPVKDPCTYLSPSNIPMMANYLQCGIPVLPAGTGPEVCGVSGEGNGLPLVAHAACVLVFCCGTTKVFRSQHSQYSPSCLKDLPSNNEAPHRTRVEIEEEFIIQVIIL